MDAFVSQGGEKSLTQVVDEKPLLENVKIKSFPQTAEEKSLPSDGKEKSRERKELPANELGLSQCE